MAKETIKSIEYIEINIDHTYNIQIEDNKNFFAQGILVHNCDDPISKDEAKSEVKRETARDWMGKTLSSRKVDAMLTPTILIMQRLHEEDPTASQSKAWGNNNQLKWIRLPADDRYKINPPELSENYTRSGNMNVMNPFRKPEKIIKSFEYEMTATEAAGQLGQDPRPAEGNKLKKGWFEQRFNLWELERLASTRGHKIKWNAVLDGAYTKKTSNSATGTLVYTIYEGKIYLRDFRKWHLEFPELIDEISKFYPPYFDQMSSTLFVEPKATGKSIVQTIRKIGGINIVEDKPPDATQKGKELRVDNITPFIRAMNVFLCDSVDWTVFIEECTVFPNGKHDDLVDCLVMATEKINTPDLLSNSSLWGRKK